jgi:hypothetical protein
MILIKRFTMRKIFVQKFSGVIEKILVITE